jgi:bisphosphoglycerate-dependent phosphoglycerate mutase
VLFHKKLIDKYEFIYIRKMQQTDLFVTSNNRLTCTVNLICEAAGLEISEGWVYENGTVVKIEGLGETCRIQMIHPDEVTNPGRFVTPEKFNDKFKDELPLPLPIGKNKLVVRHGHAGHNDPQADMNQSHDASLTLMGTDQAIKSGIAIYKKTNGKLPNLRVRSSDLKRTMETAEKILQQFPEDVRVNKCDVCIELHEDSRPIGGIHHWQRNAPLREFAIDPYISIEKRRELAPGKTDEQNAKMCIENTPKNDPIGNPEGCIKQINDLKIDWTNYTETLQKAYAQGKTYGQAASEKTLFDIIFEKE